MDIDDGRTAVEQLPQRSNMDCRIGPDGPVVKYLLERQLLTRALLDCRRISHFIVSLESFRQETPKRRRLSYIALVVNHDELFRHLGSVPCPLR